MSAAVDVLAVMDADGRAVALLSDEYYDAGKSNLAEKWSDHLSVHDEARAAVAELIEAAENVEAWITDYVPDDACGREVELRELSAALARVKGGAA